MITNHPEKYQINSIIARRQLLAKKLSDIRQQLNVLKSAIELMGQRREEIFNSTDNETIRLRLLGIDLDSLRQRIIAEEQNLSRYYSRFNRKTINIGVVGLARQGKSQLLRSLSGLDDSAIPAGRYGHCTGTRSIIIHNPDVEPHGEVYFYTSTAFIQDVLTPYYNELLNLPAPATIEEFEDTPLPPLPADKQQNLSARIKYAQLELYKDHLPDYKTRLKQTSPLYVPAQHIREFVAQDDSTGQRSFYNFLAVREAHIICSFPHENVGNIAFVDMPGLGDTGLVTEDWLISALQNDIDIIFFVKKPSGLGEVWKPQEIDLYDTAGGIVPEIPLSEWAFLVMNHVRSSSPNEDNLSNCERLVEDLSEQMKFVEELIVDCSDPEQVNSVLLQSILSYLDKKQEKVDLQYINILNDRLLQLHNLIKAETRKAKDALGLVAESTPFSFNVFNRLFRDTVKKLYTGLEQQVQDLRERREIPNETFQEYVLQAQENSYSDSGLPSLEQIEDTRNLLGGYKSACEHYLNYSRTYITRHFESLEIGLSKSVEAVKMQIVDVLKNVNQGRLNNLSAHEGSSFLKDIITPLQDQHPLLYPAFEMLVDFQISYQGFFYYRLRRHLDCLTPDSGKAELSAKPSAKEVLALLNAMHKIVLESLKNELESWPIEINQAIFATIEQFVDKVLRSENVMDEWQSFYIDNRAKVWPDSFQELSVSNGLRWQWQEATERVNTINRSILIAENQKYE
ncbi:hypothetical protein GCM10028806_29530 [Spirosoma terrae]|uniref:Dynamin family protein n=1 Tax=Spirosoma terrae TaxID=1968276 RepID=A0A6L9LJY9_9BACT|nr:hypothetical protein [Spirosoma terrae]NDU99078.1 hypothetical protein [Spirosoma terrae]